MRETPKRSPENERGTRKVMGPLWIQVCRFWARLKNAHGGFRLRGFWVFFCVVFIWQIKYQFLEGSGSGFVDWKLLFTHMLRLKNTSKRHKCPSAVNCRGIEEPTTVNCRGFLRQLTADTILIQIQAEALSHPLLLSISQKFSNLSQNLNQIYSTKSQVSNHSAINLHFSCYKCFSF